MEKVLRICLKRKKKCLKCHQVPQYMNRNRVLFWLFFAGTASLVLVDF